MRTSSPAPCTTGWALCANVRETSTRGADVVGPKDRLNHWPSEPDPTGIPPVVTTTGGFEAGLRVITAREAPFARFVPNVVHVRLGGEHLYTILANRGYRPDKINVGEAQARTPERDQIVAIPGFSGFESHLFIDLSYADAAPFLRDLAGVTTLNDWQAVRTRYAIARNSQRFWPFVDWLHHWMERNMPVEAALLELRFYDKDETPF